MKRAKRILCVLLACCMMFGIMPVVIITADAYSNTDIAYAVEGGNIYFDAATGTITACDDSVTTADIPTAINGVSVTSIGNGAFFECSNLTSVVIPEGVTTIGETAFGWCSSLTSIRIPDSVMTIGFRAFCDCISMTSIAIPDSVTTIGVAAFASCLNLTDIIVDDNNSYYASTDGILFNKTYSSLIKYPAEKSASRYIIPDSVSVISDYAFDGCSKLTSITIPTNVTSIGTFAFAACSNLSSIVIPEGISGIGYGMFGYCSNLTNLSIPDSVTDIADYAFSHCTALTDVYYTGSEEQWNTIAIHLDLNEPIASATIHYNSTGPDYSGDEPVPDGIAVFSTEKSLTVKTGESMWLGFGQISNDQFVEEWKRMAIVVSDPTVISVSEYEETEYGYSIKVTGRKQGATNVTISDTETGANTVIVITVRDAYVDTYSYAIDNMQTFYPDNDLENNIETNIYNLNGLYVNNYTCVKDGGKCSVSFDVYNSRYHIGAVDIYDAEGNWIDSEEIKKCQIPSSIRDTYEQYYYLITDLMTKKLLTYEQASFSQHSAISFEVPDGGYFIISNNFAESPGTFLFNSCDILFDATCTLIELIKSDKNDPTAFTDLIKGKIKEDRTVREIFMETFKKSATKEIRTFTKNILNNQVDEAYSGITGLFENILNSLNINWKHLFRSAVGVGESAFIKFSGPAGYALKGCFAFTGELNQLAQAFHLAMSVDASYAVVYSSIDEGFINPHGIVVNTNGNVDADVELHVFRISNDNTIKVVLDGSGNHIEEYELYNICFVKNDQLVQPNGMVTVRIPIPDGMNGSTCNVYRQESDGRWTILNAYVENSYLVFETDHFSLYAIVGDVATLEILSLPNKTTYKTGEILEPDGLVMNLDGKLISDGFICEPTVLSESGTQFIAVKYGHCSTGFNVTVNKSNNNNSTNGPTGTTSIGTTTPTPATPVNPTTQGEITFTDVPDGAWYEDAVRYVVENGLMSGYGNGRFGPEDVLTRAQLAQILYNKEGKPATTNYNGFTDVSNSAWYAEAVAWAVNKGIVTGYGNSVFAPDDAITREQFAAMLYRYAGKPETSGTLSGFTDAGQVSSYALSALKWAVEKGIINGKGSGILDPKGNATRAEAAAILQRFCSLAIE